MADDIDLDATPAVLRNVGVPIVIGKVVRESLPLPAGLSPEAAATVEQPLGPPTLVRDAAGEPVTETVHLRFTMNTIADLEDAFGSLLVWQSGMDVRVASTSRKTVALLLERDEREVGELLLPERMVEYGAAIGAAWAIANGVDPTEATKLLQDVSGAVARQRAEQSEALAKMRGQYEHLGLTGSEPGQS